MINLNHSCRNRFQLLLLLLRLVLRQGSCVVFEIFYEFLELESVLTFHLLLEKDQDEFVGGYFGNFQKFVEKVV